IRKDGMLLFNMHQGAYIQQLSIIQLLLLVFLSSTFTACSVTMTMVFKQLGLNEGFKIIAKQMVTSLSVVITIATIAKLITVMN
ncbi:ferrous iron transporter B, partial [Pseudomonas aeruginosa]